jgi:hypothetical protein
LSLRFAFLGLTQRAVACGSMVLFFFCRLFFAPVGQKITYKGS